MKSMKVSNLLRRGGKDDKKGLLKKNAKDKDDDDEDDAQTEFSDSPASTAIPNNESSMKDSNSFAADFSSMESLPKSMDSSERDEEELQKHIGELPSKSPPGKSTRWIRNSSSDQSKKRGGNRSSKKMSSSLRSNEGGNQGNIGELAFKPKGLDKTASNSSSQEQLSTASVDTKKALLKQKKRHLVRSVSSSHVPSPTSDNTGFRRFSPQRRNSTMGMSSFNQINNSGQHSEEDVDLKVNQKNAESEEYVQMSFTPEALARSASLRNLGSDLSEMQAHVGSSEDVKPKSTGDDDIPPAPEAETPSNETKRKSPRRSKSGRKDIGKSDDKKRGDLKSSRRESFRVSRSRSSREVSDEERPGLSSKRESFRRRGSACNLTEESDRDRPGMSRRESFRSRRASAGGGSARNLVADVGDVLSETLNGKPKLSRRKSGRGLGSSVKRRSSRRLMVDSDSTDKEESSKDRRRSSRRSKSSRAAIADMASEEEDKPKSSKSKSKSKSMKNSSSHTHDTDDTDTDDEHNNKKSSKSSKKKSSKKSDDEDSSPRIKSRKSSKPSSNHKLVEELVSDNPSPVPTDNQAGDGEQGSPVKRFKDRVSGYMSPTKSRKTKGKHMSLDDENAVGIKGTPDL